jgi:hypothetical protein
MNGTKDITNFNICRTNTIRNDQMIHPTQDPKYGIKDNKLVNMKTGKPIPDDEPVMLFRAKDINASDAIHSYAEECSNKKHVAAVMERWQAFSDFCDNNEEIMSEPDTQL